MSNLSFPILDIITARKGGSGKTITALVKLNEAFTEGLNVLLIDTNDMNPDAADIAIGTFDLFVKIFGDKQVEVEEYVISGRIKYRKYIVNIEGTGHTKKIGIIWSEGANRGSAHDFWKIIIRSKNIIEKENYQYVIIDTNTAFDSITPDIDTLNVRNFIFLNWLSEELGKFVEANKSIEKLIKDIPAENFILTHILRLGVLSDEESLKTEFEMLETFRKLVQKNKKTAFLQIVINNYVALSGEISKKKSFSSSLLKHFRKSKQSEVFDLKPLIGDDSFQLRLPNGIILDSNALRNIIAKYVQEHESSINKIKSDAFYKEKNRSYITKRILKNLTKELAKMFIDILRYEHDYKEKILNLAVIPYYDYDLSTLIYDLKQINKSSKSNKSFLEILLETKRITTSEIAANIDFNGPLISIFNLMGYGDIIDKRNKENLEVIFENIDEESNVSKAIKNIMGFFSGYREKIRSLMHALNTDNSDENE